MGKLMMSDVQGEPFSCLCDILCILFEKLDVCPWLVMH